MDTEQGVVVGPVPLENHYYVFKSVEDRLKRHLSALDHEYFFAGLRVAYDTQESSNEPDVLPYRVDFGYLGPLEAAIKCTEQEELSDEDLLNATASAPISIDLLDDLYAYTKDSLEGAAAESLRVGIYIVLTGSSLLGFSVACPCPNAKKKYCYYDYINRVTRCYCTTRGC